uniref:Putative secreted protein n=1 Tax=Ixodes ricinus TaxID=34613 RepID=A0A6B0UCG6_IXORI
MHSCFSTFSCSFLQWALVSSPTWFATCSEWFLASSALLSPASSCGSNPLPQMLSVLFVMSPAERLRNERWDRFTVDRRSFSFLSLCTSAGSL